MSYSRGGYGSFRGPHRNNVGYHQEGINSYINNAYNTAINAGDNAGHDQHALAVYDAMAANSFNRLAGQHGKGGDGGAKAVEAAKHARNREDGEDADYLPLIADTKKYVAMVNAGANTNPSISFKGDIAERHREVRAEDVPAAAHLASLRTIFGYGDRLLQYIPGRFYPSNMWDVVLVCIAVDKPRGPQVKWDGVAPDRHTALGVSILDTRALRDAMESRPVGSTIGRDVTYLAQPASDMFVRSYHYTVCDAAHCTAAQVEPNFFFGPAAEVPYHSDGSAGRSGGGVDALLQELLPPDRAAVLVTHPDWADAETLKTALGVRTWRPLYELDLLKVVAHTARKPPHGEFPAHTLRQILHWLGITMLRGPDGGTHLRVAGNTAHYGLRAVVRAVVKDANHRGGMDTDLSRILLAIGSAKASINWG